MEAAPAVHLWRLGSLHASGLERDAASAQVAVSEGVGVDQHFLAPQMRSLFPFSGKDLLTKPQQRQLGAEAKAPCCRSDPFRPVLRRNIVQNLFDH